MGSLARRRPTLGVAPRPMVRRVLPVLSAVLSAACAGTFAFDHVPNPRQIALLTGLVVFAALAQLSASPVAQEDQLDQALSGHKHIKKMLTMETYKSLRLAQKSGVGTVMHSPV
jgi:hypothetical protein